MCLRDPTSKKSNPRGIRLKTKTLLGKALQRILNEVV